MSSIRKRSFIAGSAMLLSLALAAPVTADTPGSHVGPMGRHHLADNEDNPGVGCFYNSGNTLTKVVVESPFVYARNRTSSRDRQLVGWVFRVQEGDPATGYPTTLYTSPVQRAYAYDNTVAPFTRRSATVPGLASKSYRIHVSMYAYTASNAIEGRATHIVDWYHGASFEPSYGPAGYCPGGVF